MAELLFIRAFVAVAVPQPLIDGLQEIQQRVQSKVSGDLVRWTKPDHIHLTLKFLGNVPADRLDELKTALAHGCEGGAPFRLELEQIGCFPDTRNPRVIWVGVAGDQEKLIKLQQRIDTETRGFGDHFEERAFRPHLTIGRVRAEPRRAKQVGAAIEQAPIGRLGEWTVGKVVLMKSQLSPRGARYSALIAVSLTAPALQIPGA